MKIVLETERLSLREHSIADAENMYNLNLDPEVMKYTGNDSFKSIEDARHFLSTYDHYKNYGFGRWAVIYKTTNEYLGWCGLKYTPELDEYDIGFRFFKRQWDKGFATEAAIACLEMGFINSKITTIVGRVMRENTASINVLKKIGLSYFKEKITGSEQWLIYKIEKANFQPEKHI